jgi:HEAT repeat protein
MDYPDWGALYAAAEQTLAKPSLDETEVELLLYALARDNEAERLREMLSDVPRHGLRLARAALGYPDRDARWQVADFLGTRPEPDAGDLLRRFVTDADEYVRRRVLIAARTHDPGFAEQTARQWLHSPHEYSRLAALSVLHELRSPALTDALDRLRHDPAAIVRNTVAEIERGLTAG